MAAGPSSAVFLAMREEEQNQQMKQQQQQQELLIQQQPQQQQAPQKKRRNQPGTPNPDAEIIALSPKTLMATNRFVCEVCNKGFQREQNLQLHRRGHNLPWKLKQKSTKEVKRKVYLCPEPTCVHHDPSRALGDLTGIKKHYSRKHGEKKYKCEKCSKKYAVQSDWKAHTKTCGTREYKCDCGTLFSRRDSFITHRAFCDALAQESARNPPSLSSIGSHLYGSNNNMSLGLSKMGSQISDHQHHSSNSTDILHFGSNIKTSTGQFDHNNLMGTSIGSAFRPSTSFFLPADQSNHQDYAANKPSIHGLMQLPDLHNNGNNNSSPSVASMFNLNFFQNSNNNSENVGNSNISGGGGGLLLPSHQFSNSSGDGSNNSSNMFSAGSLLGTDHHISSSSIPSLYGNNLNNNNNTASPMSATALLQKAAQMGSTTSNNNSASLLKAFGSSSSATKSDIHPPPPVNFGNVVYGDPLSENHLHDLVVNAYGNNDQNQQNNYGNSFEQQQPPQKKQMLNNFSMENMGTEQANRLTRDFLGVGEIVRSMSGGFGSSHRDHQQQQQMNTLDSKAPQSHHQSFGGAGNFQ
ncbi:protein indeterminate-domain 5, chloroplastic-like [Nicotiana tomentosiformis]|uniref:protein indeterminate-domain 5, chloroplastic-like n=1 Tax=Nicotiana tomentosiformis TaxID=4098 RepID=UPI00051AD1AD|nr:protein indeterminate-domain 5, chloroplastic-like [Nicotiana tomentosiformis]XP_009590872.1 protein indeterminate-domain 5, chloroplastic-like [Nicotiana tomentosiformis]